MSSQIERTGRAANPLNYVICLIDAFSFNFGMAFWSLTTIVPLFLHQLHASNIAIGAFPGMVWLGYSLPGILVSKTVSRLKVAKWWLFWVAVAERVPLLAVALAISSLGVGHPHLILMLFIGAFAIHAFCLGLNQPAYWMVVGKIIPATVRGRVYGWAGAVGAVTGLTIEPITRHFLTPTGIANLHGFASCFIFGMVILLIGIIPFIAIDEPETDHKLEDDPHDGHFLHDVLRTWRSERPFRILVFSQVSVTIASLAQPFFVLAYTHSFPIAGNSIAQFTTISVVSAAIGSLMWGTIADRYGNRLVLLFGAILAFVGPAIALFQPPPFAYNLVFMVVALSGSALMLASYNIVIEYAGGAKAVPYYTTIFNTVLAPVRALAPIIGGVLADKLGFSVVFATAAVGGLVSIFAMINVVDPRKKVQMEKGSA